MQRFFFSKLLTETNSFSNIPTTLASFELAVGEAVFDDPALRGLESDLTAEVSSWWRDYLPMRSQARLFSRSVT